MVWEFVKVFAALLVTLAAVYLMLRFLKQKMLPQKGMIEMVHYQSFGPKRGIAVIKILNNYMAVGIADESISLLSKLNPVEIEEWQNASAPGGDEGSKTEDKNQKMKLKWLRTKRER